MQCNQKFDAQAFISSIDAEAVGEIHLADHAGNRVDGIDVRIDDHGSEVWDLLWIHHRSAGPPPDVSRVGFEHPSVVCPNRTSAPRATVFG